MEHGTSFDEIDLINIQRALDARCEYEMARDRLIYRFRHPWIPVPQGSRFMRRVRGRPLAVAPFGWTWQREAYRNASRCMPWWVWLIHECYTDWRRYVFTPFIRWGLLQGPDGGYFHEFRWSWRWWESEYAIVHPRWSAFGERFAKDWRQRMPTLALPKENV